MHVGPIYKLVKVLGTPVGGQGGSLWTITQKHISRRKRGVWLRDTSPYHFPMWVPTPRDLLANTHTLLRGVEWIHGLFLFPLVQVRENVVATCKIGSFLCSLDNLLQENVFVLFFGNQISKWRSFEKWAIFDLVFTFSSHQGKVTKLLSAHVLLTYIHVFCSPYQPFLPYQFWKKYKFIRYGFSFVWVLVLILIRAILEQSINNKIVSKI